MFPVVCFLWKPTSSTPKYLPDHVNRLQSMLARHLKQPHKLYCITDDPAGIAADVECLPLPAGALGLGFEFPKLYAFSEAMSDLVGPRFLMLDIDIVLVDDIDPLLERPEPFVSWSAPDGTPGRFNTSVVLMDAGAFPEVWANYCPGYSQSVMRAMGLHGLEQDWVWLTVGDRGTAWARTGDGIESFQRQCRPMYPAGTRIVAFNGNVSPEMARCQREAPWIAEHWR